MLYIQKNVTENLNDGFSLIKKYATLEKSYHMTLEYDVIFSFTICAGYGVY